jgi:hemerythrin-like domain-containing protein
VTGFILAQTAAGAAAPDPDRLIAAIDAFIRMYRPHAAREDTVLFPALRQIVGPAALAELGEQFEAIEEKRFGEGGFASVVDQVAELERALGIHALAQFTPASE